MVFYEIRFHGLPDVKFACSNNGMYSSANRNIIDHRTNLMELFFNETLGMHVETPLESYDIRENTISLFMPDQRYEITFPNEEKMKHISSSVGVRIQDLFFCRHDLDQDKIMEHLLFSDPHSLFLPQILDLDQDDQMLYQSIFKRMMNHAALIDDCAEQMLAVSAWLELVVSIHSKFKRMIFSDQQNKKVGTYHIIKAKKFIGDHYCEGITSRDIARRLDISTVYLSKMFRKETGITVTDYINRLRMNRVCELLLEKKMSIEMICTSVGFKDCHYVQKLFKNCYGISMRRFQQLGHGLTFHVDNPYFCENLDHDITKETIESDMKQDANKLD